MPEDRVAELAAGRPRPGSVRVAKGYVAVLWDRATLPRFTVWQGVTVHKGAGASIRAYRDALDEYFRRWPIPPGSTEDAELVALLREFLDDQERHRG